MRFSDFLLVSDPLDLDFIVGYKQDQNIRINVLDLFNAQIIGSGTPGYVPVFSTTNQIEDSVIYQDGSNIVIGSEDSLDYTLAVTGSFYVSNGAVIDTTISGNEGLRVIAEDGNIFVVPNDLGQSISSLRRIIHPPAILISESATLGQLNAAISNLDNEIDILLALKVDKTSIGVANGVASLDSGGKVPLSQIPDSIIGQVQYMGTWNASTNTPTLNPLVPEERGHYYVVSAAGVFGGIDYAIGDWIISNGTEWQKVDNTDAVTSVFGRIGAILALEGDYQSFYPRLSQAYENPTFINSLAFAKITGVPAFLLENQNITLSGDVTGSGKTSIASTISNNAVTDSKLRDSLGTSVIGRSSSTTGDPADIQATTDGHVLLRSAGNLLFGLISGDSISSIDWSKITGTPTTLGGYGITNAYTKTEADNKFVPYTGANANVNLGSNNITANSIIKSGGTSVQFLKADGSVDVSQYVPTTRSINAGTGLTGGGNLSSDITIAFDTAYGDNRYAYRTRQLTINGETYDLSADRTWSVGTVNNLTTVGTGGPATLVGNTLNIPNYTTDLSGYVTLATDQTITGLKTILRGGDVLNFKIGTDTLYGLKVAYNQNELVPSGEATWSFVNTFNRDGSGFSVTPLSFFRGVLVTGERLLSASVNANLLDYYGNNPSGRYPVYAYNTGVQQFSDSILVGFTTGLVNAVTGAIASLPSGVVANFNGRVIGVDAVNANEFATLGQVTSTSRAAISLTTTGTSGPATYSSVTGVLNIPEYQGGVTSFNTRTGAVTLTSGDVTTALGYTPVTDLRTLTINGETYNLTADRSWTIGVNPSAREIQTYIATASQTTFTVTGGYTVGLLDVFINGVRLTSSDFTATNGTTVVLAVGTMVGNIVDIIKYTSGFTNAVSGSGTTNELAYFTGSTTIASLSTGTYPSLAELSYVKGVTSSIQTQLNGKQVSGNYVTTDTTQTITAQKTFTTSGSSDTMIISHGSGSGFALDVLKAGSGEAIRVTKTSGSGNAMTISGGNFEAGTIVKTGGTSAQFLMADGSVNTNVLASGAYLPLAGGTLSGALNGTSAAFTGAISGSANTITATTGIAGDFTNNSTTNETLRARNNGSGNIAAFRNGSGQVASISNAGGLTLSGALNGTSAVFSSSLQGTNGVFVGLAASSTTSTLALNQGAAPYGHLTGAGDSSHGLIMRGIPANGNTSDFSVTPTDVMSFYEFGGEFRFYKKNGSLTQAMTLTGGGNLLVGTTTDAGFKLDVNGTGRFSGNVGIGVIPTTAKLSILISESGASPTASLRVSNAGNGYTSRIIITDDNTNDAFIQYVGTTQSLNLGIAAFPNTLRLFSNGNSSFIGSVTAAQFLATSNNNNAAIITSTGTVGYGLVAVGSAGGARDTFLAGQSGFSNGFTVQYTGSVMKYGFQDGNLGIANTNPLTKLHITQSVDGAYPTLGTGKGALFISGDNNLYGLYVGINTNDGNTYFQAMRNNSATAYNIVMQAAGGNVGIGTSSEDGKLSINTNNTGAYNANGYNGVNANIRLTNGSGSSGRYTGIAFTGGGSTEGFFGVVQNSSTFAEFVWQTYNGSAYGERMRMTSSGNVLIGTTTDNGAKLNVNGGVVASTYATTSGALSVPSATYTTVFTFNNSDNMAGIFVVRFLFTNASTVCFFSKSFDGGNTKLTIGSKTNRDGSDVISVSENGIQVYHNTGVAVTANWSFTRIS